MTTIKNILYPPLAVLGISIHAQEQADIYIPPLEMVYPDVKELEITRESRLPDNPIKIEELGYSVRWVCGVVPNTSEEPSALTALSKASVIYKLEYQGILEKWIPIDGKSEQFNVYKLKN